MTEQGQAVTDASAPPRRGARRPGIRVRITAVAASVVALALLFGAIAFWFTLRTALYSQLELAAQQDAVAFAEQVDQSGADSLPDVDDDRFWQVIDRDSGGVVAASEVAEDAGPVADREGAAPSLVTFEDSEAGFVTAAEREGGDVVVVAGRSVEAVAETLSTIALLLAIAVPVVIVLVAATTWFAVGRALAPVERMRRQVEAVTASDISRRVDHPGTSDELGRLAMTLNGMLARLQESQAVQRRFISDASHELKSPLASLRQYAEVAESHPDRISPSELGQAVRDEGERMERLVQAMLVLTRADEGKLAVGFAEVDLDDLLLAEAARLRTTARGITVDTTGIAPVRVSGDIGLLRQLVRNLADNAARHARGRVAFSSRDMSGEAVFAVDDDGPGIPAQERDRVFERFVRLDDARARDAGGSGLGLAIVREIALVHGGSVRVSDGALGGAHVEVHLPL